MRMLFRIALIIVSLINVATVHAQSASTDLVNGMNTFAFDLYHSVSARDKSTIISPYSLSFLLDLLVSGSTGNTQAQLVKLLHLDSYKSNDDLNTQLNQLNTTLLSSQDVMIANAFWADETLSYQPAFLATMGKINDKSFKRVNFSGAPDQAKDKINVWVAANTKGAIKTLLDQPLSVDTRLVLTNAIYFKGLWSLPFNPANTQQRPFKSENGKSMQVAMMNLKEHFHYAENDALQMLQLNYAHSTLAIAILLPKDKHHLQDLQLSLDNQKFMDLIQSAQNYRPEVMVALPKFKLNSLFNNLPTVLQKLGLKDAFDRTKADFSGMISGATPGSIYVSDIIQKAMIEVDEQGTVAAAATAIVMSTRAAIIAPKPPVIFTADHPFLFIIYDTQSKLILFIGQVATL